MRPPCWWWLVQIPAYNTSRPPSLRALPCVAAWLACWCRWRFVPCWPFAWRFARFWRAGGINTPAAPVALNIRPFSLPCVSYLYKHHRAAVVAVALFRLPCRVSVLASRLRGLLAAPVRINIRRRDFIPRGLRCPCQSINAPFCPFPAVLAAFRRCGGVQCWRGVLAPVSLVSVCL